jgi:hypothetical protein
MSYVVNGIEVHDLSTAFEVAAKGELPTLKNKALVKRTKKGKRLLLSPSRALGQVQNASPWQLLPWVLLGVAVGGIAVYLWSEHKKKKDS